MLQSARGLYQQVQCWQVGARLWGLYFCLLTSMLLHKLRSFCISTENWNKRKFLLVCDSSQEFSGVKVLLYRQPFKLMPICEKWVGLPPSVPVSAIGLLWYLYDMIVKWQYLGLLVSTRGVKLLHCLCFRTSKVEHPWLPDGYWYGPSFHHTCAT